MVWYHRGNVVYIQSQKEKEKNHSRLFSAPGNAYGPPRAFPPPREREKEISSLAIVFLVFCAFYGH
jgi:hypothetical protein